MREKSMISRREFAIKGIAAIAGLSVLGLAGCTPKTAETSNEAKIEEGDYTSAGGSVIVDSSKVEWSHETDVLIVGCGGAGSSAALKAREAGCEVLAIEKGSLAGGCTMLCGQAIATGGTKTQKEIGIDDTVEAFTDFLVNTSDGDPELLKVVGMDSLAAYEWLEGMGMATPAVAGSPGITFGGNHLQKPYVPRTHWTEGIWPILQQELENQGVETLLETPAIALITDAHSGEVLGVVAQNSGKALYIKARKAVVLSAGGFTHNDVKVKEHITTGTYVSFSSSTDDGDGISLGQSVGAGVSFLNSGNDASAYDDPPGACVYLIESAPVANDPAYIAVNANGKRFVDESEFQTVVNRGIMAQPGGLCYVIAAGEDGRAGMGVSGLPDMPASLKESDTLEGLASELGIDANTLVTTVQAWNEMAQAGIDAAFGRERCLKPIEGTLYVAATVYPGFSSTLSGITADTEMHALAALTGEPIPRLFVAGANSNALGRTYCCCGSGVAGAITTGRIAGINAAKLDAWA